MTIDPHCYDDVADLYDDLDTVRSQLHTAVDRLRDLVRQLPSRHQSRVRAELYVVHQLEAALHGSQPGDASLDELLQDVADMRDSIPPGCPTCGHDRWRDEQPADVDHGEDPVRRTCSRCGAAHIVDRVTGVMLVEVV